MHLSQRHKELVASAEDIDVPLELGGHRQCMLHFACALGRRSLVRYLVKEPQLASLRTTDALGWTPLHAACYGGHGQLVQWLLNKGADATAATLDGNLPIHYLVRHPVMGSSAEEQQRQLALKQLLGAVRSVDVAASDGSTPLVVALTHG